MKIPPQAFCASASIIAIALLLSACAATDAIESPRQRNFDVLQPGMHRDLVREELGTPITSISGADCDVYSVPEGSTGWKYLRALGYSALDVGTLGISEVVTEPIEKSTSKQTIEVRVCYNGEQRVIFSERLENGNPGTIITGTMPPPPADSAPKPGN